MTDASIHWLSYVYNKQVELTKSTRHTEVTGMLATAAHDHCDLWLVSLFNSSSQLKPGSST